VLTSEAKEPSLLLRGVDVGSDFVPILSNVKDATIALTGVNPVTQEKVGVFGRVASGVFAVPAVGNVLKYVGKGTKYVLKGGKAAYEVGKAAKVGTRIAEVFGRRAEKQIAEQGAERLAKEAEKAAEHAAAGAASRSSRKLATEANQAVFWSGIPGQDKQAAEWVERHGGTTLEKTLERDGITLPPFDRAKPETVAAWRKASEEFAKGARGDVRVLQEDRVGVTSVWREVEFKALKHNPNITSITAIDPRTGLETLLWKR
jgi:hypothetical protein